MITMLNTNLKINKIFKINTDFLIKLTGKFGIFKYQWPKIIEKITELNDKVPIKDENKLIKLRYVKENVSNSIVDIRKKLGRRSRENEGDDDD